MSMGAQIRAGAAYVELKSKDSGFTRGLDRASRRLKAFGASAAKLGGVLAGGGGSLAAAGAVAVRVFSKIGDQLDKASKRTGFAVESLSALGFAAEQSGADLATLEKGIRTMQRSIVDAGRGLSTQTEALEKLGLSYEDLAGLTPEQQFMKIAQAISEIDDPTTRAAVAMQILGRSGQQLLPLFENGAAGIEELVKQAHDLGIVVDSEAASAAAELTDRMNILRKVITKVAFDIGSALAPMLISAAKVLTEIATRVGAWVKENRGLVRIGVIVAAAITGLGAALVAVGLAFGLAGFAITGFLSVMAAVGTVIGIVGGAIAALISPIGLVIAGVVALGGVIAAMLVDFTAVGEYLRTNFTRLLDGVLNVFAGIKGAIEKGDIELAFRILGKTLEVVWINALGSMKGYWADFVAYIFKLWGEIRFGLGFGDGLDIIANAEKERIAQRQGIENEIKSIEEDLDKLVREGLKPGGIFGPPAPPPDPFDGLTGYSTGQSSAGTAARGTFNNFGLGGLGNPIEKSIEENTKRTAQAVERIEENTRTGAVFT